MDKKYAEVSLNRREALKKIGQCAEYTGAVVAFLSVSSPSWASAGTGTAPGCGGISAGGRVSSVSAGACVEIEADSHGVRVGSNATSQIGGIGQAGSSSAVSTQLTGGINNSVSLKVDNSVRLNTLR